MIKNIRLLFFALSFFVLSCSNDDSSYEYEPQISISGEIQINIGSEAHLKKINLQPRRYIKLNILLHEKPTVFIFAATQDFLICLQCVTVCNAYCLQCVTVCSV